MEDEREALAAEAVRRYGSVHAFCKARKDTLCRSTVYMLFSGTYPGNAARQLERIRSALYPTDKLDMESEFFNEIKRIACGVCSRTGQCNRCDALFRDQTRAVMNVYLKSLDR